MARNQLVPLPWKRYVVQSQLLDVEPLYVDQVNYVDQLNYVDYAYVHEGPTHP